MINDYFKILVITSGHSFHLMEENLPGDEKIIPCVELLYEAFKHHRDVRTDLGRSSNLNYLN